MTNQKTGEVDINCLIQRCASLKRKFLGVFAANIFPQKLKANSFVIVNAATTEMFGAQLLLSSRKEDQFFLLTLLDNLFCDKKMSTKE